MNFQISGLALEPFASAVGLDDEALARHGALRYKVDEKPSFPSRHARGRRPRRNRTASQLHPPSGRHAVSRIVRNLRSRKRERERTLSVRAFDSQGMMLDADLAAGNELRALIERFFGSDETAYLHVLYAKRGCFAARVDRA